MIKAEIICDSVNPAGVRLTTFVLVYPRFLHCEVMTHRQISRNAASSRAIPIEKMIAAVEQQPAVPEQWGRNQKGMQAEDVLTHEEALQAELHWMDAAKMATLGAAYLTLDGVHKQIANRVLEPFSHITVVATASSWTNFFALRAHPMAQPEFQVLAYRMLKIYIENTPTPLSWGSWHLPFVSLQDDRDEVFKKLKDEPLAVEMLARVSAARCARVSYLTHDGVRSIEKDLELYDRLVGSTPLHASALEHPAMAAGETALARCATSNFDPSWCQLRKMIPRENVTELDLAATLAAKPDWITL